MLNPFLLPSKFRLLQFFTLAPASIPFAGKQSNPASESAAILPSIWENSLRVSSFPTPIANNTGHALQGSPCLHQPLLQAAGANCQPPWAVVKRHYRFPAIE
jgi:hypothetical protein